MKTPARNAGTTRPKSTTARRTVQGATPVRWPVEHEIRVRAYEIFQRRGGAPGRALDDWLQAEREVHAEYGH